MINLKRLSLLIIVCAWLACIPSLAQEKPNLQTLFNESTELAQAKANASSEVIVIDLSEWQTEYKQTLTISNGKSYKFTNGGLIWTGGDEPLIVISGNSTIDFDNTVTVSGNALSSNSERSALIVIKDANVQVHGATFNANKRLYQNPERWYYFASDVFDIETVNIYDAKGRLSLYGGHLNGSITCQEQEGTINIYEETSIQGEIWTDGILCMEAQPIYYYSSVSTNNGSTNYKRSGMIDLASNGRIELCCNFKSGSKEETTFPVLNGDVYISKISVDAETYASYPRLIVIGVTPVNTTANYMITQSDVNALTVQGLDTQKYELALKDNAIYIQEKSLTGQEWLQEQINSWGDNSSDTNQQPATITIPEEGIELTDLLYIPNGAYVKLVGGPITLSNIFSTSPDVVIVVSDNAHLYIDNTWDFNNIPLPTKNYAVFGNFGHLTFGEKAKLVNTWSDTKRIERFIRNNGRFDCNLVQNNVWDKMFNGVFVDGSGDVVMKAGYLLTEDVCIIANTCTVYGGLLHSSSIDKPAVKAQNFYMHGGEIFSTIFMDSDYAEVTDGVFDGNTCYVNTITATGQGSLHRITFKDNDQEHCLSLTSSLKHTITINANWSRMDFSTPYVIVRGKDYHLIKSDLDNLNFVDLPEGVRAKLEGNTIVLTNKKPDLHDLFDNDDLDDGTEENPANIMGDEDDVVSDEPEDMKPDLHVLFGDSEDKEEGEEPKKSLTILFDGDYGIRIPETSSVEFKNINIDLGEHGLGSFIEVYGKLIINVNVYIHNVCTCTNHVIYVHRGGTLIWRGGSNSIPGVVIYNDGGTVIYEGGNTYGSSYGIYTVNGGTINIKGGSIGGGEYAIYNHSNGDTHIHSGCNINGPIYTNGNITTGGNAGINYIYIPWSCHINLTSSITYNWYINVINIQNIKVPVPFIYGTDGYQLTEDDLKRIKTNLPDSYCLILDINVNIIYIVDTCNSGIESNILNTGSIIDHVYNTDGRLNNDKKGMKIIRYSDGTIKKVILK